MKINRLILAAALIGGTILLGSRPAWCEGDIVCSARFYISPRGSKGAATSHFRLFRISADGSGRRQITSGAHEDQVPQWSPDGKSILFMRDGRWACVMRPDGSGLRQVIDGEKVSVDDLCWSPDSRDLVSLDEGKHRLQFINARTGQMRLLSGVNEFSWSPGGRYLAWAGSDNRLWISSPKTKSRASSPLQVAHLGWAGPQVLVAALEQKNAEGDSQGLSTFVTLDAQAHELKRFPIQARVPNDDGTSSEQSLADWRSNLMPVKSANGAFTLRWDNSTSSGQDGFYFRGSAAGGALKLVAHGQSFAWAPDGRRFCWAPYYELSDYNAPGQRKRVVYTSPLKVGGGRTPRTLISGLVLIDGCDWR